MANTTVRAKALMQLLGVIRVEKRGELGGTLTYQTRAIPSQAPKFFGEGVETIPQGSRPNGRSASVPLMRNMIWSAHYESSDQRDMARNG